MEYYKNNKTGKIHAFGEDYLQSLKDACDILSGGSEAIISKAKNKLENFKSDFEKIDDKTRDTHISQNTTTTDDLHNLEICKQLERIDMKRIRPLAEGDIERLEKLNVKAIELRKRLK